MKGIQYPHELNITLSRRTRHCGFI